MKATSTLCWLTLLVQWKTNRALHDFAQLKSRVANWRVSTTETQWWFLKQVWASFLSLVTLCLSNFFPNLSWRPLVVSMGHGGLPRTKILLRVKFFFFYQNREVSYERRQSNLSSILSLSSSALVYSMVLSSERGCIVCVPPFASVYLGNMAESIIYPT